jgi:hypothetical protein
MNRLHRAIFSALSTVDTPGFIVQKGIPVGILGGAAGFHINATDRAVIHTDFTGHTFFPFECRDLAVFSLHGRAFLFW